MPERLCAEPGCGRPESHEAHIYGHEFCPADRATSEPDGPEFYLIGELECHVCHAKFKANSELSAHLDSSKHRLDAMPVRAPSEPKVAPRWTMVEEGHIKFPRRGNPEAVAPIPKPAPSEPKVPALCPPHRLVGAGDYGGTEVGMMCGDCGIDAGDIEDECEATPKASSSSAPIMDLAMHQVQDARADTAGFSHQRAPYLHTVQCRNGASSSSGSAKHATYTHLPRV